MPVFVIFGILQGGIAVAPIHVPPAATQPACIEAASCVPVFAVPETTQGLAAVGWTPAGHGCIVPVFVVPVFVPVAGQTNPAGCIGDVSPGHWTVFVVVPVVGAVGAIQFGGVPVIPDGHVVGCGHVDPCGTCDPSGHDIICTGHVDPCGTCDPFGHVIICCGAVPPPPPPPVAPEQLGGVPVSPAGQVPCATKTEALR